MKEIVKKIILKKAQVELIKTHVKNHQNLIVLNYQNLKVTDLEQLKNQLNEIPEGNCVLKVHKNTMMKRALSDTVMADITSDLTGMNLMIHSDENISLEVIKTIFNFQKDHPKVKFHKGFFENLVISEKELIELAKIPTRETLLIKLCQILQAAPYQLLWTLNQLETKRAETK